MAGDRDELLLDYAREHSLTEDEVVRDLIEETRGLGGVASMQIRPIQGPLLHVLVRTIGARSVLEIGTFTGMSALWMARALPPGGRLVCCDVSEEWTSIARRAWERAGVADRIELRIGPALETLDAMPLEPRFHLAFVDADKPGYPLYLEAIVPRLVPGGILVADNVLWHGQVVDPGDDSDETQAIRRFNDLVASHPELDSVLLPVSDGMTLARKRG